MVNKTKINKFFASLFELKDGIFYSKNDESGYWSNLNQEENKKLIETLDELSPQDTIKKLYPKLYDVIFSKKREAGLELLQLKGTEVCIDYGCMWGALSVPLAKRAGHVISVDQTRDSLKFLSSRYQYEGLNNVTIVNQNIKKFPMLPEGIKADCAVINGVLEWVPETGNIELNNYYGKKKKKTYAQGYSPRLVQLEFLKSVKDNLSEDGRLYLAIENRFDFKMFFGVKDPHANLLFTTIFPKIIANVISLVFLSRPYVTYIYSKKELKKLLADAGFSDAKFHFAFPDYRFPELIKAEKESLNEFKPTITIRQNGRIKIKRLIGYCLEFIIFRILNLRGVSPSFIVIAEKVA